MSKKESKRTPSADTVSSSDHYELIPGVIEVHLEQIWNARQIHSRKTVRLAISLSRRMLLPVTEKVSKACNLLLEYLM
jgi:hypothetical protein